MRKIDVIRIILVAAMVTVLSGCGSIISRTIPGQGHGNQYYPGVQWDLRDSAWRYRREEGDATVWRCPLYVPKQPSTLKRLLHLGSFALSSFFPLMAQRRWKPDRIIGVVPTLLFVPCVGYGPGGYRLGYGGGFYDRTLAALEPHPYTVGLSFAMGFVDDLLPEAHDVPLEAILNENGAVWPLD